MPYIKRENRKLYEKFINYFLKEIEGKNDDITVCKQFGGFVGDFSNGLIFLNNIDNPNIKKVIKIIQRDDDILRQSGEINYFLSAIYWGILGENAPYGKRCFLQSMIVHVMDSLSRQLDRDYFYSKKLEKQLKKYEMKLEDYIYCVGLVKSILTDILNETYRRKTAPYEDNKIMENGDLYDERLRLLL